MRLPMYTATVIVRTLQAAAVAVGLLLGAAQAGEEPSAGLAKAYMCLGCHVSGNTRATFPQVYSIPRIRGQSREYIVYALNEYRANRRNFPYIGELVSMPAVAASLSDQDIEDLADYFSSLGTQGGNGR